MTQLNVKHEGAVLTELTKTEQPSPDYLFGRKVTAKVFFLLCLLMVFDFSDRMIIASILPYIQKDWGISCLLYTSPSPRDRQKSRMPSSA